MGMARNPSMKEDLFTYTLIGMGASIRVETKTTVCRALGWDATWRPASVSVLVVSPENVVQNRLQSRGLWKARHRSSLGRRGKIVS